MKGTLKMYFDRFDICEAWYLWLAHNHTGQWSKEYERLCRMERYFRPSPFLTLERLSDNARAIYDALDARS
jgi:hypothetical protein